MLVEISNAETARVLELDDYDRIDDKAIELERIGLLHNLLDRDDVTVKKIVIARENSNEEATLIDDYLKEGMAGKHSWKKPYASEYPDDFIKTNQRRRGVEISEDKIVAKYRFADVVDGSFEPRPTDDQVNDALIDAIELIDEDIESLEQRIEELEDLKDEYETTTRSDFIDEHC